MAFSLGSFVGGAVDESARQRKLRMDEEDQSFQREQQQELRDERARQQRVRQGIAGVQRPGSYAAIEAGPDGVGPVRPAFKVSEDDYYKNLSGVYGNEGMIEQAEAMRDRAFSVGQRQRSLRQQRIEDGIMSASRLGATGDLAGGFNALAATYDEVPDGFKLVTQQGPDGSLLAGLAGQDGKWRTQPQPLTPENFNELVNNARKFMSTEMFMKMEDMGIRSRQVGAAEKNAETMEQHRLWQQSRPNLMQDGTGRIIAVSPDGTRQIGAFGSARPVGGSGSGAGGRELPPQMVADLNAAAQAVDNAKTPQERQAAQQRYMNLYSNAATAMGKVLKPGEVKGNFAGYDQPQPQQPLKLVQDQATGTSIFVDTLGQPRARMDPMGQFPMVPFQEDPRSNKDVFEQLKKNGVGLDVVTNPSSGAMMWAYRGKDGRLYSTPGEAINPPQPKVGPSGGTATGAAQPSTQQMPPSVGDKTLGLDRRLANAITADNKAGTRSQFNSLVSEVEPQLRSAEQTLRVLNQALANARPSERAPIQRQIETLQRDLPIMQGIVDQRKARAEQGQF